MNDILHHPGRSRPHQEGAPQARAAIDASLPPLSRAPKTPWFYQIVTKTGKSCLENDESLSPNRTNPENYGVSVFGGVPGTFAFSRPRPIVAAATALHADASDVPAGRFRVLFSAYTVNRYWWVFEPGQGGS